ncbi:MAG TPA: LamG-like jellyroll fold domain-containing protein [Chitinophaga sp.]|uniref:LamG-like jellyroll fold domain-containing protein n=1 Tax=Chitinophaga sp. TaxID=1869181 RepID=UPI002CC22C4C|nr:LamG-like jellyroll fold domain-containing protein [Chitinophaga sp.]HVI49209.1 LamG-like jellyroll fold domain-containing protein [Chitinophaga sp.]
MNTLFFSVAFRLGCLTVMLLLVIQSSVVFAQNRIYANTETHQVIPLCIGCDIRNPSGSLGSNENDYATLIIGASVLGGSVRQTLIFPQPQMDYWSNVVISFGKARGLSLRLLGSIYVKTYMGSTDNNDEHLIDSTGIEFLPDSTRATYSFQPQKKYDRVEITLNGGLLGLSDSIRLYYAYNKLAPISECASLPRNPMAYYPLDGNTNDYGPNKYNGHGNVTAFSPEAVCNTAIEAFPRKDQSFTIDSLPGIQRAFTISFWVKKLDNIGETQFSFETRNIGIHSDFANELSFSVYTKSLGALFVQMRLSFDEYTHIVVTKDNNNLKLFSSGHVVGAYHSNTEIKIDPTSYNWLISTGGYFLDEVIFYNRTLTDQEVANLYNSYRLNKVRISAGNKRMGTIQLSNRLTENLLPLQFFPNPTAGFIRIGPEINPAGGSVSIIDMAGKEVSRSILQSSILKIPDMLPDGTYLIYLQTKDGRRFTGKVVVNRRI